MLKKTYEVTLFTWHDLFTSDTTQQTLKNLEAGKIVLLAHDAKSGMPLSKVSLYDNQDPNEMVWDNTLPVKNPAQYLFSVWSA